MLPGRAHAGWVMMGDSTHHFYLLLEQNNVTETIAKLTNNIPIKIGVVISFFGEKI